MCAATRIRIFVLVEILAGLRDLLLILSIEGDGLSHHVDLAFKFDFEAFNGSGAGSVVADDTHAAHVPIIVLVLVEDDCCVGERASEAHQTADLCRHRCFKLQLGTDDRRSIQVNLLGRSEA